MFPLSRGYRYQKENGSDVQNVTVPVSNLIYSQTLPIPVTFDKGTGHTEKIEALEG
jgi:hypothetical protein